MLTKIALKWMNIHIFFCSIYIFKLSLVIVKSRAMYIKKILVLRTHPYYITRRNPETLHNWIREGMHYVLKFRVCLCATFHRKHVLRYLVISISVRYSSFPMRFQYNNCVCVCAPRYIHWGTSETFTRVR